jgi:SAM-dependent methyltransferase
MGNETSKARTRRLREGVFDRILIGRGMDIGCGDDPITPDCVRWDRDQGDAATLPGVAARSFDWVYSSHCLDDLPDPRAALRRWWEVLKPGGHLLLAVPDEDLYEQGLWPSRGNPDHRATFTIHKSRTWSPVGFNLADLLAELPNHQVLWIRTCDDGYDYSGGVWDRTHGPAEAGIEACVRKTSPPGPLSTRRGEGEMSSVPGLTAETGIEAGGAITFAPLRIYTGILGQIGDIVMFTATARRLKELYPEQRPHLRRQPEVPGSGRAGGGPSLRGPAVPDGLLLRAAHAGALSAMGAGLARGPPRG